MDLVAFEKESDIGGVWHYTPESDGGRVCVFNSVYANSNRVSSSYSDFPYSDDLALHPHHSDVKGYLKQYAKHFKLPDLISFNTEVISVENDHTRERRWTVRFRAEGGNIVSDTFDGVMVCTGLFS